MSDELSAPLGKKKPKFRLPKFKIDWHQLPIGTILTSILIVMVVIIGARIVFFDDPEGGRPTVEVGITSTLNTNSVVQDVATPPQISTQIEVGPEFEAPDVSSTDPQFIIVDDNTQDEETPELAAIEDIDRTLGEFGAYPELLEQTQHGGVPRISTRSETPFSAYARASISPASANGRPLVAIIVTGLGLNETTTLEAISSLPENVTLAFAPYGATLRRTASVAQSEGHELFLEVPMEPFDYPQSDPGPHTLLTNQQARANLDRLFWLMARFGGYVGVINNQGARFSSSVADFGPIMEELGVRGIGYVDDGSSNRSLSRQLSRANQVPYIRAHSQLDTNPSRVAILTALSQLEEEAKTSGSAVGVISALPVSVSTLVSWIAELDDRGITLVPASALMSAGQ